MFLSIFNFNGDNYRLWSQIFCVFVGTQRKIGYFLDGLLDMKDPSYYDYLANDCCIITWLLYSMKEKVSSVVIFFKTGKSGIYLKDMRKIFLEFLSYASVFSLPRRKICLFLLIAYYSTLRGIFDHWRNQRFTNL